MLADVDASAESALLAYALLAAMETFNTSHAVSFHAFNRRARGFVAGAQQVFEAVPVRGERVRSCGARSRSWQGPHWVIRHLPHLACSLRYSWPREVRGSRRACPQVWKIIDKELEAEEDTENTEEDTTDSDDPTAAAPHQEELFYALRAGAL